jgi:hypothetical protein
MSSSNLSSISSEGLHNELLIKNDNQFHLKKWLNYKIVKIIVFILVFVLFFSIIYCNIQTITSNNCPIDCKEYINGDISINGKICKVPVINGVKCPTNCVYEKEDNKYVKYSDCNCDLETPIKTPIILAKSQGNNVKSCPINILCNDCKIMLKLVENIPTNPVKTDLILNFEPLKKSIYITNFLFKIHAYSNNNSNVQLYSPQETSATVQILFLNSIDNKSILPNQVKKIWNDERNKEIIFNINMKQPVLINSDSTIRLFISNPNKDDISIDYLSSLIIEYKHIL